MRGKKRQEGKEVVILRRGKEVAKIVPVVRYFDTKKLHRRLINVELLRVKTLHGLSFRAGAGARARAREDSVPAFLST